MPVDRAGQTRKPLKGEPVRFMRMRCVLLGCSLLAAALSSAHAAGFSIDPDPNSPTLGEILDREARANAPRPALKPIAAEGVPVAAPRIVDKPLIPREAVTVLAPRVRQRPEPSVKKNAP